MARSLPTFEKRRLMAVIAVLSFGLTSLFAVLALEFLVPATFVAGFFILLPLVWLLGEDFPLVEPDESDVSSATEPGSAENPVARLRERYATGEIDDAEFEHRLDRLLETEELEDAVDSAGFGIGLETGRERTREREAEFE